MNFLTAAFLAVWLLTTLYLIFVSVRQRRLEQELAALEETLETRRTNA